MIRPPAVAGTFYPADPVELESFIQFALGSCSGAAFDAKALIVPHAGYIYSGEIAGRAYRLVCNRPKVKKVILLGPAHRAYVEGLALSSATHFQTPLGSVPVATELNREILSLPQVQVSDQAHLREHSLEVQLPFLQQTMKDFKLVPLLVGDATPSETAEVIDKLWGGEETLLVISSDLSHFHPYNEAQQIDQSTSEAIIKKSESLTGDQACGCRAINGFMRSAKRHGLNVSELARCNSGDTAGEKDSVVGYGSYALY